MIDKELLGDILKNKPEDYYKEISKIIETDKSNAYKYLAFSIERVAYFLNEELFLYNYKVLDDFDKSDWKKLVSSMNSYGQDHLLHFLKFHTNFSDSYLKSIGLESDSENESNQEKALFKGKEIKVLTNNHPRVMDLYKRIGLNEKDIKYIHSMKGR